MKWLSKLKEGQLSFSDAPDFRTISNEPVADSLPKLLHILLKDYNGFFAFANALHVFNSDSNKTVGSLEWWNNPKLWISSYEIDFAGYTFFAEDIFGWQFAYHKTGIFLFDPIEGSFVLQAKTLHDWINLVVSDPTTNFGYNFAKQWQENQGVLTDTNRIFAYPPFIFASETNPQTYRSIPRIELMPLLANIYKQTKHLDDGQKNKYDY